VDSRYPDFKHKKTHDALWLDDRQKPSWVETEMAALAPGTVHLDSFTWNKRIARSAKAGEYEKTMELFKQMQSEGMNPNKFTFVPILNPCASLQALQEAKCVHKQVIQCGCESDAFVRTSLVDIYAKCGSMEDALRVFKKMPSHDVVSWTALLLGHVKCGQGQKNDTGRHVTKLCHFCGGPECLCKCRGS
jgi:pentatricopeptide repeat protein